MSERAELTVQTPAATGVISSMPSMSTQTGLVNVFSDAKSFETALKMAECLSQSTIVPKSYQGNAGNCMIAIEMASRINTSPMMVMQNLYIVNGNPAWSSQWIISMINSSKRYKTELQYEFGHDPEDDGLSCRAWAEDLKGHRVYGPKITMKMAKEEGWLTKSGSKWKTMPEVMIQYRAASFFGRVNCPDMIMGIYSQEEVVDMVDVTPYDYDSIPQTSVDPDDSRKHEKITQEQRKELFSVAKDAFGADVYQEVIKGIIEEFGLESTQDMTVEQYDEAMSELNKLLAAKEAEAEAVGTE